MLRLEVGELRLQRIVIPIGDLRTRGPIVKFIVASQLDPEFLDAPANRIDCGTHLRNGAAGVGAAVVTGNDCAELARPVPRLRRSGSSIAERYAGQSV